MAVSVLNKALQTIQNRTVRQAITFTAADDDYTGSSFSVEPGSLLTLVVYGSDVGSAGTKVHLQGSVDNVNFLTLKDINVKTSDGDIATAGSLAESHNPSTSGDYPYYRVFIDNNTLNGSTGKCWVLQN